MESPAAKTFASKLWELNNALNRITPKPEDSVEAKSVWAALKGLNFELMGFFGCGEKGGGITSAGESWPASIPEWMVEETHKEEDFVGGIYEDYDRAWEINADSEWAFNRAFFFSDISVREVEYQWRDVATLALRRFRETWETKPFEATRRHLVSIAKAGSGGSVRTPAWLALALWVVMNSYGRKLTSYEEVRANIFGVVCRLPFLRRHTERMIEWTVARMAAAPRQTDL